MHKCGLETIQRRVLKGNRYYEAKHKPRAIDEPEVFSGIPRQWVAKKALAKVLKRTSNGETLEDIAGELKSKYNVDVFVLSGNNEKQIYHLFYVALEIAARGLQQLPCASLQHSSKLLEGQRNARGPLGVQCQAPGGRLRPRCLHLSLRDAVEGRGVQRRSGTWLPGRLPEGAPYRRPVAFRAGFIAQVNQPACLDHLESLDLAEVS